MDVLNLPVEVIDIPSVLILQDTFRFQTGLVIFKRSGYLEILLLDYLLDDLLLLPDSPQLRVD